MTYFIVDCNRDELATTERFEDEAKATEEAERQAVKQPNGKMAVCSALVYVTSKTRTKVTPCDEAG